MIARGFVAKRKGGGSERRRFKRFRANFLVKCLDLCGGKIGNCDLFDISAQGLGLVVRSRFPPW